MNNGRQHTSTNVIIDFIMAQLRTLSIEVVAFPSSRDVEEIFSYIPTMQLPSAVVTYMASKYSEDPNRIAYFSVLVTTKYETDCAFAVSAYLDFLDQIVTILDYQIVGNIKLTVTEDETMRLDKHSMTCSLLLKLKAEDF